MVSYLSCGSDTVGESSMDGGPPACTEEEPRCDWEVLQPLRCAGHWPEVDTDRFSSVSAAGSSFILGLSCSSRSPPGWTRCWCSAHSARSRWGETFSLLAVQTASYSSVPVWSPAHNETWSPHLWGWQRPHREVIRSQVQTKVRNLRQKHTIYGHARGGVGGIQVFS